MKHYELQPKKIQMNALPDSFYEELNPNQRKAVEHQDGPMLVIAGAGSGKTKTLVYRVAKLVHDGTPAHEILLLTFTRKAAQEMISRASQVLDHRCQDIAGGTFHAFAHSVCRRHAQALGLSEQFVILDRADADELIGNSRKAIAGHIKEKRFPKKRSIGDMISRAINTDRSIGSILEEQYPHYIDFEEEICKIQVAYQQQKKELSLLDYDDLLTYLLTLLKEHPSVKKELQSHYKYILIDEYQDTNKCQAEIVKEIAGVDGNVMVVGDDAQSIYSFRGAHFKNIISFPDLFPKAKIVTLDQNYRSTQHILDLCNRMIQRAPEKFAKHLFTEKKGGVKPAYIETESENEQSRFICQKILELREEGTALSDIAVLFRSSPHANDLEVELKAHNIPYVKHGGFKFTETAHIKDLIAFVRVLFNCEDAISWQRILCLLDGLGPKAAQDIFTAIQAHKTCLAELDISAWKKKKYYLDLVDIIQFLQRYHNPVQSNEITPTDCLDRAIAIYTPHLKLKYDDHHKRETDLESLLTISERYTDLEQFLAELSLEPPEGSQVASYAETEDEDKLVISTIHSAKGLEWKAVFCISLVDGYIPSFRSLSDREQIEEERRLLYVAMSRAKTQLFLLKPNLELKGHYQYGYSGQFFSKLTRFLDYDGLMQDCTERWQLKESKNEDQQERESDPFSDIDDAQFKNQNRRRYSF